MEWIKIIFCRVFDIVPQMMMIRIVPGTFFEVYGMWMMDRFSEQCRLQSFFRWTCLTWVPLWLCALPQSSRLEVASGRPTPTLPISSYRNEEIVQQLFLGKLPLAASCATPNLWINRMFLSLSNGRLNTPPPTPTKQNLFPLHSARSFLLWPSLVILHLKSWMYAENSFWVTMISSSQWQAINNTPTASFFSDIPRPGQGPIKRHPTQRGSHFVI